MAISFHCACGKALRVADDLLGKKIRCPSCRETRVVKSDTDRRAHSLRESAPEASVARAPRTEEKGAGPREVVARKSRSLRRLMLSALPVLLLIAGGGFYWWFFLNGSVTEPGQQPGSAPLEPLKERPLLPASSSSHMRGSFS